MATGKPEYVNQPFPEEVRSEAYKLIEAGKVFDGKFWRNRDRTCKSLGYSSWESLPQAIKSCVNQIGRSASKRGKKKAKEQAVAEAQNLPLGSPAQVKLVLSKETLEEIALGDMKVPHGTPPDQIKVIREYITRQAGFDPKKTLLGIDSHMER